MICDMSRDVNRGSKNRNSLQFRVLEIEFLNSKLDFNFCISALIKCNNFHANKLTFSPRLRFKRAVLRTNKYANAQQTR